MRNDEEGFVNKRQRKKQARGRIGSKARQRRAAEGTKRAWTEYKLAISPMITKMMLHEDSLLEIIKMERRNIGEYVYSPLRISKEAIK